MFKNQHFYHQHVRKAIIAFGMIFNNINIVRDNTAGEAVQSLRVPLAYSTKQKFLSRIALIDSAEARNEVAITLPRMGFEITSLDYDPSRKISLVQRNKAVLSDSQNNVRTTYTSTPYNLSISMYVFAKNQEDGLQIIEQILPFFNPDFNVTVNDLPELGIKRDIKITLDSVAYDDQYEGEFAARQSIVWTLNFTMRLNFYGNVANINIIKETISTLYDKLNVDTNIVDDVAKITVTPGLKSDGTPTQDPTQTVDKSEIDASDNYAFIVDILEGFDNG